MRAVRVDPAVSTVDAEDAVDAVELMEDAIVAAAPPSAQLASWFNCVAFSANGVRFVCTT